ncbi:hypothetical protein REPUB_Repub05bG0073000 [Reevesia pubescens]
MEDTALGASALLHDRIHQTDKWKFQADQHKYIPTEPCEVSQQPRARRGPKGKLSEAQKREKKRQCDVMYRLNKKMKVNEMTAQNKSLQEQIGRLSIENRQLKEETRRLTAENGHLEEHNTQLQSKGKHLAEVLLQKEDSYISQSTSLGDHQSVYVQEMTTQNKSLQEEIGRLNTENRRLKEETGRLTAENRHLGEHIEQLQSKEKLPAEILPQRQDSYISQSTIQNKHDNNQILASINITTQHYINIEAENSLMRAQFMELSQRLQSLNEIISYIEGTNVAFDAEEQPLLSWSLLSLEAS